MWYKENHSLVFFLCLTGKQRHVTLLTCYIVNLSQMTAYSLWNLLVRAEVPPTNDSSIPPIQHGMFRCTSRCVTCQEHILESDSFKSHTTGAHHKIRGHITCNTCTSNIIYLIPCRIPCRISDTLQDMWYSVYR